MRMVLSENKGNCIGSGAMEAPAHFSTTSFEMIRPTWTTPGHHSQQPALATGISEYHSRFVNKHEEFATGGETFQKNLRGNSLGDSTGGKDRQFDHN
jgi:hypothetical protein